MVKYWLIKANKQQKKPAVDIDPSGDGHPKNGMAWDPLYPYSVRSRASTFEEPPGHLDAHPHSLKLVENRAYKGDKPPYKVMCYPRKRTPTAHPSISTDNGGLESLSSETSKLAVSLLKMTNKMTIVAGSLWLEKLLVVQP